MAGGLGRFRGGIRGLLALAEDPVKGPALEADLFRHGYSLEQVGTVFSWYQLKVFIEHMDETYALMRVEHPEEYEWMGVTGRTNMLLAGVLDALNWLVWAKTKDGARNRNAPQPTPRPGIEPTERRVKGEAIPIDQFKERMALLRARLKSSTAEEQVTRVSVRKERESRGSN